MCGGAAGPPPALTGESSLFFFLQHIIDSQLILLITFNVFVYTIVVVITIIILFLECDERSPDYIALYRSRSSPLLSLYVQHAACSSSELDLARVPYLPSCSVGHQLVVTSLLMMRLVSCYNWLTTS